ncbi:MAG: hypothetical protein NT007_12225 [Candidatus Kapabacteria bacterium]|nr:hypothetical protein [Candidatus Kapabacteria bacterium]
MEGDSRIRGNDRYVNISCFTQSRMQESPKVALEGDSCIRRNDIFVKYVAFETASTSFFPLQSYVSYDGFLDIIFRQKI